MPTPAFSPLMQAIHIQPRLNFPVLPPLGPYKNELPRVTFADWTQGRIVPFWGTNAGADVLPFQSWRHFKEAFAPELIARAVNESAIPVKRCIDPFGGSGTTALSAQFLGVECATIEVNPFLADLIEAKLTTYNPDLLAADLGQVVATAHERFAKRLDALDALPPTFVEPGVKDRWIFNKQVADRIASFLSAIQHLPTPAHRRLFRVLLGGILLEVSNAIVNGKGRRYRRGWEKRLRDEHDVEYLFCKAVRKAITDVHQYRNRACLSSQVLRGDCRQVLPEGDTYDLVVCSPPYPNSFDYTDVYNIELWTLGYLTTKESNTKLRNDTLSSHVQISRSFPAPPTTSATLAQTLQKLVAIRGSLWDGRIPDMVGGYFAEMNDLLRSLFQRLTPGGKAWLVVGDSRYGEVHISVATILIELAQADNWKLESEEPFRSMRASPQQGGRAELVETLLVFSKPLAAC